MQAVLQKQTLIDLGKIKINSNFESGNLKAASIAENNQINLWIGSDPNSNYKTWFYFTIEGVTTNTTITFTIMNMSNQVKLFKQGHVPVYRNDNMSSWSRLKIPIQANAIGKSEEGFKVTFKHLFMDSSKHHFAFTYPWTLKDSENLITTLMEKNKHKLFSMYDELAFTSNNRKVMLLTVTKSKNETKKQYVKFDKILKQVWLFPQKPGIFISARVHPGEVAASHMLNGILKYLFSGQLEAHLLLERFVFYIVPIINPDGVSQGNFRTDSRGNNLNRYYTNPDPIDQPQIFGIKSFLVEMIKLKRIGFCLDLHAHVNKQGSFIYGNSISSLKDQTQVCLFPKILSFNCEYFDYESCNFSEKNMSSKDKTDELSKEGAARVAIFKDTGLAECWTLECNYNSCKIINTIPKCTPQNRNNNVTNSVLISQIGPEQKQQFKELNIAEFERIGSAIMDSIIDFYELRENARIFGCKLKNFENLKINVAVAALRMLPYRFDTELRKLLNNINSQVKLHQALSQLSKIIVGSRNRNVQKSLMREPQKFTEKYIKIEEKNRTKTTKINQKKIISSKVVSLTSMIGNELNKDKLETTGRKPTLKK